MQGNLKQVQLPEVLQFISMGKSTGLLTVRSAEGETTLMIRDGRIINSSSLDRQRRLGDLLVHRGILKRSTLAQILNLQRTVESDKRVGQILVERDIVTESTIREVLRLQLEEEIWNLFGLEEGEFRFEQADESKLGEATVQIDIEPLLLEGTRRQDEWRKIIRRLTSDQLIPAINPKKLKAEEKLKISPGEWKVLAQINGRFPIRAIVNRAAMGRFEVYRILDNFLHKGLIEVREPAPVRDTVEAPSGDAQTTGQTRGGGLFGLLKPMRRSEDKDGALHFVSPIGAMAYFINRLIDQVYQMREFKASPPDARLLDRMWTELVQGFTKADLIVVEGNHLNAGRLERFLDAFEFSESTQDCYEDSIEAVSQLLDGLYRVFAQRIGERACVKVVRETLEEMTPRLSLDHGGDFRLDQRVQMVLRLAA